MNRMVMVLAVGIIFALPLFGGVEGSWSGTIDVEYAQIEQTVSLEVLSDIITFIQEL